MLHWGKLAVSHAMAVAACVLVPNVIWIAVYSVLFLFALVTNGPMGSPISLPLTSLLITVSSLLASALVFGPATLIASRARATRPLWVQAPIEFLVAATVAFVICTALAFGTGQETWQVQLATAGRVWLLLSPGLGLYWFVARSAEALLGILGYAAAWVRRRLAPVA